MRRRCHHQVPTAILLSKTAIWFAIEVLASLRNLGFTTTKNVVSHYE